MSAQVSPVSPGQPFFVSTISYDYPPILDAAYLAAKNEALRIYNLRGIQTVIELLRPIHLNIGTAGTATGASTTAAPWVLPGSVAFTKTLKSNVAFFPWGVLNNDPTWWSLKWYQGNQTQYIGDWYVRPVYFFEEQQGAWAGVLENYNFRGDQTFSFIATSSTGSTIIQGWILAWAVLPVTTDETQITTT
jgi:hypothetical protein